jgi:hypothetical protein
MKLKIVHLVDRGVANKERLHLSVLADTNLTYYAVFDTEITAGGGIVTTPKHVHWFTDVPVKAGDHVILYTGPGAKAVAKRSDGSTNHFFHWGQKNTLWNKASDCVVLVEINSWATSTD